MPKVNHMEPFGALARWNPRITMTAPGLILEKWPAAVAW
jgi:hypothetical protein